MIEQIITELGDNYNNADNSLLEEMINDMELIAKNISNRANLDGILNPYIKKSVKSAYLLRGNEGMNSRNEGSISTTYEDIQEKLRNDIIKNGLRLLK